MISTAVAVGAGYVIGAVPTADLVARRAAPGGPDLRSVGSGNPGGLNVARQLGGRWGALVTGLDIGKGVAAAAVGRRIGGPTGANLAASAAVTGHCHPPGRRRGGKGVATSVGQVVGTFPRYLPIDVAVAVVTAAVPWWKQRTRVATTAASAVWLGASTLAWYRRWPTGVDERAPWALPAAAAWSSAVIAGRFADTQRPEGEPFGHEPA